MKQTKKMYCTTQNDWKLIHEGRIINEGKLWRLSKGNRVSPSMDVGTSHHPYLQNLKATYDTLVDFSRLIW